jgi:hypothetical protein
MEKKTTPIVVPATTIPTATIPTTTAVSTTRYASATTYPTAVYY